MRPYGTQKALEQRRQKAVELMQQGHNDATIARRLNTTRQSVWRWRKDYKRRGEKAMDSMPVPGRPARLSHQQRRGLIARLVKGALAHGFATDLWTCPRIAQVIEECYGVRYHVDHIPRLLANLGFSCQRPERRAIERDEEAIRRWVQKDWPRIKKSPTPTSPHRFHR